MKMGINNIRINGIKPINMPHLRVYWWLYRCFQYSKYADFVHRNEKTIWSIQFCNYEQKFVKSPTEAKHAFQNSLFNSWTWKYLASTEVNKLTIQVTAVYLKIIPCAINLRRRRKFLVFQNVDYESKHYSQGKVHIYLGREWGETACIPNLGSGRK
jgi:hypothetical protein